MVLLQKGLHAFSNTVQVIQQACHVICSWVSVAGKEHLVIESFLVTNTGGPKKMYTYTQQMKEKHFKKQNHYTRSVQIMSELLK
jgi:hypothetical protein